MLLGPRVPVDVVCLPVSRSHTYSLVWLTCWMTDGVPSRHDCQLGELRHVHVADGPSEHYLSSISLKKYYQTQEMYLGAFKDTECGSYDL